VLEAVQPKVIVVADSDFPVNRRAGDTLKKRLAQTKISVI